MDFISILKSMGLINNYVFSYIQYSKYKTFFFQVKCFVYVTLKVASEDTEAWSTGLS